MLISYSMQQHPMCECSPSSRMSKGAVHGRREKKTPAKQLKTFSEISTLAAVVEEAQPDPLSAANMVWDSCRAPVTHA